MEKAKARVAACRLEHQGPTSYEVGMEKAIAHRTARPNHTARNAVDHPRASEARRFHRRALETNVVFQKQSATRGIYTPTYPAVVAVSDVIEIEQDFVLFA